MFPQRRPSPVPSRPAGEPIRRGGVGLAVAMLVLVLGALTGGTSSHAIGIVEAELSILQGAARGRNGQAAGVLDAREPGHLGASENRRPLAAGPGQPEEERSKGVALAAEPAPARPPATVGRRSGPSATAIAAAGGNLTIWSATGPPARSSR